MPDGTGEIYRSTQRSASVTDGRGGLRMVAVASPLRGCGRHRVVVGGLRGAMACLCVAAGGRRRPPWGRGSLAWLRAATGGLLEAATASCGRGWPLRANCVDAQ